MSDKGPCSVRGCPKPAKTSGLCQMHYMRWWKTGTIGPAKPLRNMGPPSSRFEDSITRNPDGCWIWVRACDEKGYPLFRVEVAAGKRRSLGAHRWAYEHFVGAIPAGLEIDHLCGVRACVNPAHMEPVTHQENVRRIKRTYKTECIHGHPRTEANYDPVRRACRVCERIRSREFIRRKRAALAAGEPWPPPRE